MIIDQQLRSNDCGISAVKTVCNILDAKVPRGYIEERLPIDQEGVSLEAINQFFKEHGFDTQYHLIDFNDLDQEMDMLKNNLPCLAPVKVRRGLHYLVVNGFKQNKLEVYDPATAKSSWISIETFKSKAYYATSVMNFEGVSDLFWLKVQEALQDRPIEIPNNLSQKEQVQWFNKLCYFHYVQQNFGFKDRETEDRFLEDLLWNQEIQSVPKNFKNLILNKKKQFVLKTPILLSVSKTKTLDTLPEDTTENIYLKLFRRIKGIRSMWWMFGTTTLMAGVITYLAVFINQILIDHILPSYQLDVLYLFAIGVGIFYFFDLTFTAFKRYISIHLGNALDRYFLTIFDQKLNTYSIRFLHNFRRGDLTERLKDSTRLKSFFLVFFSRIFVNVLVASMSIFILLAINWQLSIFVFVVLAIFALMFVGLTPIIRQLEQQRFAVKADFYSRFIEKIDAIQVIKALRLESYSSSEINANIDELIKVRTKARYISLGNSMLSSLIIKLSLLFIILFTSRQMIIHNTITLGMIITFVALSGKIFRAFRSLLDYNLTLQEHAVILRRFFDFEEQTAKPVREDLHQRITDFSLVKFSLMNVSFGYNEQKMVLKDLNFEIGHREKVWIQGKNGSGKSTLCKILGLLYEPSSGDLMINDVAQRIYNPSILRSKVVLVSSDDTLFNDSLLFNITFGRRVDMKKLIYLTKALNFYDYVQEHPDKFDRMIHENGRNLSTGQRKKVLLLRALMTNAELIILDEIFNGIDSTSKLQAEQLINSLPEQSFIIISHMPVDEIDFSRKYILKNGRLFNQST
jgi:subfamily B ATP-binding cassette protein HlyB/CyaB